VKTSRVTGAGNDSLETAADTVIAVVETSKMRKR
jgi:hypothetical protein